jgi:hypothetical protein
MGKKTFISYNYSDAKIARTVRSFFSDVGGPVQGKPVSLEQDVTSGGDEAVDQAIKNKMAECDTALFLVGDDAHNSNWITREVQLAVSNQIPIVVAQLPRTTGGIPNALKAVPHQAVAFKSRWVAQAVNGKLC